MTGGKKILALFAQNDNVGAAFRRPRDSHHLAATHRQGAPILSLQKLLKKYVTIGKVLSYI